MSEQVQEVEQVERVESPSNGGLIPVNGPAALALAASLGATMTATSLEVSDTNLPFQDWENLGRCISFAGNAWQWWVGDWMRIGETLYGEDAAQGVDDPTTRYEAMRRVTGVEHQTLLNVASVARRVAPDRRRVELRFSYHAAVAPLDPEDQVKWLQAAIDNQWGVHELRQAIRDDKNPIEPDPDPDPDVQVTVMHPPQTLTERLEEASRHLWASRQPMDNGYWADGSGWAQLGAALGEE